MCYIYIAYCHQLNVQIAKILSVDTQLNAFVLCKKKQCPRYMRTVEHMDQHCQHWWQCKSACGAEPTIKTYVYISPNVCARVCVCVCVSVCRDNVCKSGNAISVFTLGLAQTCLLPPPSLALPIGHSCFALALQTREFREIRTAAVISLTSSNLTWLSSLQFKHNAYIDNLLKCSTLCIILYVEFDHKIKIP